jgi:ABC-2 type transport system permease protein
MIAVGVFFSSLTKNQIVAAAMTFALLLVWIVLFTAARMWPADSVRYKIATQLSFIHLWEQSLNGRLLPRDFSIQASIGVFAVYLTTKVLEARRWF